MKHFDENVTDELREIRSNFVSDRWGQLQGLSKEAGESAIKFLFATNAGGAVTVLAYLGAIASNSAPQISTKITLMFFFVGLLFVGFYKAYTVHKFEGLFKHYQKLVDEYYEGKIGWGALIKSDEAKVGSSIVPYIFAYLSFGSFIVGSVTGAYGFF